MSKRAIVLTAAFLLLAVASSGLSAVDVDEALASTKAESGLAVNLSATPDGTFEKTLATGRELLCFDAETDEFRWTYQGPQDGGDLYRPIIARDLERVIVLEGPSPANKEKRGRWKGLFGGRYPAPVVDYIVAGSGEGR